MARWSDCCFSNFGIHVEHNIMQILFWCSMQGKNTKNKNPHTHGAARARERKTKKTYMSVCETHESKRICWLYWLAKFFIMLWQWDSRSPSDDEIWYSIIFLDIFRHTYYYFEKRWIRIASHVHSHRFHPDCRWKNVLWMVISYAIYSRKEKQFHPFLVMSHSI